MDSLLAFLPIDRQLALANYTLLPLLTRGAALFADLSGFTPLTEALVRALGPHRGAEELTRQLNLVYDALIGQVENYGGTVIGFSGDAITCWFDEDSGRGAIAAALAMQHEMEKFAAVPIPNGGSVALALKAAVVEGRVKRFAVGDANVQLIDVLAGATLDRLAEAEHHTEKGQVLTDESTALALGDQVHIAEWVEDSGERFAIVRGLADAVEPFPWDRPDAGMFALSELKPWVLAPVFARIASGQADFLAELRPAVSLFMRFGGIDFENDEEAGARLDNYVRWVQSVVSKYDGILVQLTIGDKGSYLYAAFGAPVAHDDDAVRALRTAIELRAPPQELSYITAPQIGVSRGRMRVGTYGGTTRRTYGVLGDEVNVAARLMQAAQPGQILVTERMAAITERGFRYERLEPLRVKGKSSPLGVLELRGERTEMARALESDALPIVGRRAELEVIDQLLERTVAGQGQVVLLLGEAGVGKSRLAQEALRRAGRLGFEEYRGECPSYGTMSSYLVWHGVLRAFFRLENDETLEMQLQSLETRLREINPDFELRAPLLGPALNLPIPENDLTRSLDARVRKQLVEEMIVECVCTKSLDAPRAFLLEDCHWMDALSQDLVEILARETADRPVMIIETRRPPENEAQAPRLARLPNTTTMVLGDFTSEEAGQLIELKLQQVSDGSTRVDPEVVQRLVSRAGGNPFYIEELLNYMHDRGLDPSNPRAFETLDLPDSLASLILSRIDRLSEPQRSTLKVASIVGRQFLFRWLWGVYPTLGEKTQVRTDLDDMSRLDLTPLDQPDPQRSYIFRHVLTHQVTYESQPYATRAELHGQLGHYLEQEYADDLERNVNLLAHHYDRSEELNKRRIYLRKAGEQAQSEYANEAAISYYERLMPLLSEQEKPDVMLKLGQVYEVVGRWDDEKALYLEGLDAAARWSDGSADARLRTALGSLARKRGEFADAARWLDEAQRGFEASNDRAGIGQALQEAGTVAVQQSELDKGRAYYEESLEIRRELGERRLIGNLLNNLGIIARMKGDTAQAGELYNESLEMRREIGDRWGIAISLNNLGVLRRQLGEYPAAREVLEESLTLWRQIGDRMNLANTLTSLSEVLIDQSDAQEAQERLVESMTITRGLGDKRAIAYLLENFARAAILQQDGLRAAQLLGAAAEIRRTIGSPLPQAEQKILAERLGALRATYGDTAIDDTLAQGQALTMDEAITFALESTRAA